MTISETRLPIPGAFVKSEILLDKVKGVKYMSGCLYDRSGAPILETFAVDRDSVVPLYYQIQRQLLGQIQSGELKGGDPLPSEQQIAIRSRVSRMTSRQALKSLCKLGVAYSLQGKGTFVSGIKLEKNFRQVRSFSEEMEALGYRPGSRVVAFELIPAHAEAARALGLKAGEGVFRLQRVRLADSAPMGLERAHLPKRLFPDLKNVFNGEGSLYETLWKRYGTRIAVADEDVEVGYARPEEARLLRVPSKSAVFVFTRTSYVQDGQAVEFVKSVYRVDRYKIVNRLTRLSSEAWGGRG